VKQQNKKAIQLLPHLSEILTYNLQPAVYTVRSSSQVVHWSAEIQTKSMTQGMKEGLTN